MKKLKYILLVALFGLVLVGCQQKKEQDSTKQTSVSVSEVAEEDPRLMVAQSQLDEVTVFEYQLPKGAKSVSLWKDTYEDGMKGESDPIIGDFEPAKKGLVVFGSIESNTSSVEESSVEMDDRIVVVSMANKDGFMKVTEYLEKTQRFTQTNPEIKIDKQGSFPLYFEHYSYQKKDEYSSLPIEFLYKPEKYLADIGEGEKVDVYRLVFE